MPGVTPRINADCLFVELRSTLLVRVALADSVGVMNNPRPPPLAPLSPPPEPNAAPGSRYAAESLMNCACAAALLAAQASNHNRCRPERLASTVGLAGKWAGSARSMALTPRAFWHHNHGRN